VGEIVANILLLDDPTVDTRRLQLQISVLTQCVIILVFAVLGFAIRFVFCFHSTFRNEVLSILKTLMFDVYFLCWFEIEFQSAIGNHLRVVWSQRADVGLSNRYHDVCFRFFVPHASS
jgi:hypothetical protein